MPSLDEIVMRFRPGSSNGAATDGGSLKTDEPEINDGAARIFDPLHAFGAQLSQILQSAATIEQTLGNASQTFEELGKYRTRMTRLTEAYQTMLSVEALLHPESEDELRQHLAAIARIFHQNICTIASSLDPVCEVHSRIARLERILNNLEPLQEQLRGLAHNFEPRRADDSELADQPPTPSAAVRILPRKNPAAVK
jgi:hypothetical protein